MPTEAILDIFFIAFSATWIVSFQFLFFLKNIAFLSDVVD